MSKEPGALQPSLWPAFALVYNIVIAALFAHLLWFRLLALYPAGIASISTLLIPVVGLLSRARSFSVNRLAGRNSWR